MYWIDEELLASYQITKLLLGSTSFIHMLYKKTFGAQLF